MMAPFDTAPWGEDRDWEWHTAAHDTPEQLRALFDDAVGAGRAAPRRSAGLRWARPADGAEGSPPRQPPSLRWILVHMIEEYARHNGHADLIRESIDGEDGRIAAGPSRRARAAAGQVRSGGQGQRAPSETMPSAARMAKASPKPA